MTVSDFRQIIWITCNIMTLMENLLTKISKDRKIHKICICKVTKKKTVIVYHFMYSIDMLSLRKKLDTSITVNQPNF